MWSPTENFLRGKIIKPFLPFEKHPNLHNDDLKNLYPGDEVFIFETQNDRWARGYALSKPFPNDFTITSVNLDDLPGLDVKTVVFPFKYVNILEEVPITKIEVNQSFNNVASADAVPTIQDSEFAHKQAVNGSLDDNQNEAENVSNSFSNPGGKKLIMPTLPMTTFHDGDLLGKLNMQSIYSRLISLPFTQLVNLDYLINYR